VRTLEISEAKQDGGTATVNLGSAGGDRDFDSNAGVPFALTI